MKEINEEERTENLINRLLEVWEDSVKATHTFLSNEEIENIKNMYHRQKDFMNIWVSKFTKEMNWMNKEILIQYCI